MKPHYCYNCGQKAVYNKIKPIDTALQNMWQISSKLAYLFNVREGSLCSICGANVRAQGLAKAILNSKYGYGQKNLLEWANQANKHDLKVCELNSCHRLHDTLCGLKNLTYSEFGTKNEQNIEKLTYKDNQFDLVLHSETLEHVSNPSQAMAECRRVVKKDGIILFTIPIVWDRPTRQRAKIEKGKIKTLLKRSYHGFKTDDYLVFYEYGFDVDRLLGARVAYTDWRRQNYVFTSGKSPITISVATKRRLKLFQSIATYGREIYG